MARKNIEPNDLTGMFALLNKNYKTFNKTQPSKQIKTK